MCYDKSGLVQDGVEYSIIRREYGEAVRKAGGEPIFLELSIDPVIAAELCDGIVISGGQDIEPAEYGQRKTHAEVMEPLQRTRWERHLIQRCDERGIPVFGVCYGLQLLNVHYGGTLHQDLHKDGVTTTSHGSSYGPVTHDATFTADFLGFQAGETAQVVSRHHQAVDLLAPGFVAVAESPDGVVEAIAGNGHFGVQWHAESDGTSATLYSAFVDHCDKRRDVRKQSWHAKVLAKLSAR
jgi:putative glutamine amidotransferase